MFQEFPYTNFHQLNLDWIVKIAKDFLDQYTHIQEVIQTGLDDLAESRETGLAELDQKRIDSLAELNQKTLDGLADLQEKYDTLDGLLQSWYDTHSADIAGQLADAIIDFNAAAETKSQALLDSWPADYSELVTEYNDLKAVELLEFGAVNTASNQSITANPNNNKNRVRTKVITVPENVSYVFTFSGNFEEALCVDSINGSTIKDTASFVAASRFTVVLVGGWSYRLCFKMTDNAEMSLFDVQYDFEIVNDTYFTQKINKENGSLIPVLASGGVENNADTSKYFVHGGGINVNVSTPLIYADKDCIALVSYENHDCAIATIDNDGTVSTWLSYDANSAYKKVVHMKQGKYYRFMFKNHTAGSFVNMNDIIIGIFDILHSVNGLTSAAENDKNTTFEVINTIIQGNTDPNSGNVVSSDTRCTNAYWLPITNTSKYVIIDCPYAMNKRVTFVSNVSPVTIIPHYNNTNWTRGKACIAIPEGTKYFKISLNYNDGSDITPSDCADVKIYLSNSLKEYYGKTISFLGDSITTYAGDDAETAEDGHLIADGTYTYPGNHCRYPQSYMDNVEDCYWMILLNALDARLGINESWAGSRVSWNGITEGSDVGANICISSQHRIDHLDDNGTPDIILVNAGTNDIINLSEEQIGTFDTENPENYTDAQIAALSDPTSPTFCVNTFAGAYRTMLIRLLKKYKSSEIVCMLPNFTSTPSLAHYTPDKADKFNEIIKQACDFFGIKCIDARAFGVTVFNLSSYTGDGVHPNVAGMKKYGNDLVKKFKYDIAL